MDEKPSPACDAVSFCKDTTDDMQGTLHMNRHKFQGYTYNGPSIMIILL